MELNKTDILPQRVVIYIDIKRNEVSIANNYEGKLEPLCKYESRWELSKIVEKFILRQANLDKVTK